MVGDFFLILLLFLGIKTLMDGIKGEEEECCKNLTFGLLIVQGIATSIDALSLEELQGISDKFGSDIYDAVSLKTCVEKRLTIGAPGIQTMQEVIQINKKFMEDSWLMQRKGDIPL